MFGNLNYEEGDVMDSHIVELILLIIFAVMVKPSKM